MKEMPKADDCQIYYQEKAFGNSNTPDKNLKCHEAERGQKKKIKKTR